MKHNPDLIYMQQSTAVVEVKLFKGTPVILEYLSWFLKSSKTRESIIFIPCQWDLDSKDMQTYWKTIIKLQEHIFFSKTFSWKTDLFKWSF